MNEAHRVEARDPSKRTSKRVDPALEDVTRATATSSKNCFWNDEEYAQGTSIRTDKGVTYVCAFGYWEKQNTIG